MIDFTAFYYGGAKQSNVGFVRISTLDFRAATQALTLHKPSFTMLHVSQRLYFSQEDLVIEDLRVDADTVVFGCLLCSDVHLLSTYLWCTHESRQYL